jgi:DNA ligase-associated metallophosphoesterase
MIYNGAAPPDSDHLLSALALTEPVAAEPTIDVCGVTLRAGLCGALYWAEESLLIVSDLHLEKGSSYAARGVLLPPFDTVATLANLAASLARFNPKRVISLGDSFHDRTAHTRLGEPDRAALRALQLRRDWIWVAGNHDPNLPDDLGGQVAQELTVGLLAFRHEPTGAAGEISGHLHPKARVVARGRSIERRCFAGDGERLIMPAYGAYAGGLNIRHEAFAKVLEVSAMTAHVIGDQRLFAIARSRCC